MRFIIFSIILAAIVVGTTYLVGPEMRSFHEGYLGKKSKEALSSEYPAGVEVEMHRLHAEKIVVTTVADDAVTENSIKEDVAKIVQGVYGAYTEPDNVMVKYIDAPKPPIKPPVKDLKSNENTAEVDPPKPKPESPKPKPEPPEPPKPVLLPSELSVEWDAKKSKIMVSGRLVDMSQKNAFISQLEKNLKQKIVIDDVLDGKGKVAKSKFFGSVVTLIPEIIIASKGAGSLKLSDAKEDGKAGVFAVKTLLENKSKALALNEKITKAAAGKYAFNNEFTYLPEFSIIKDDKERTVYLRGYGEKYNCVNLDSNVKRYTLVKANNYKFKSEIIQDARSLEYTWSSTDQDRLKNHLERIVRGEIHFNSKGVSAISGVTDDADYHRELTVAYENSEVKNDLKFDPNVRLVPQQLQKLNKEDEERAKAAQEALRLKQQEELRGKLKPVKVYFDSGQKSVDAKYEAMIKQAAADILASPDKKSLIVVGGFADHTGDAEMNKRLSKDRARSVQAKLIAHGIPASRTKAEFFGAEKPSVNKKLSRRVEIRVR